VNGTTDRRWVSARRIEGDERRNPLDDRNDCLRLLVATRRISRAKSREDALENVHRKRAAETRNDHRRDLHKIIATTRSLTSAQAWPFLGRSRVRGRCARTEGRTLRPLFEVQVLVVSTILSALLMTMNHAAQPTLTSHMPDVVARGTTPAVGAAASNDTLDLSISLPLHNDAELRALVDAVTNPASPEYRHYLSEAEFTARYSPSVAEYRSLVRFALAHGLHPRALAANRLVLDVAGTVADVERTLHLNIRLYRALGESRTFYAPDREPTLEGAPAVLHISGLDDYDVPVSHFARGGPPLQAATGSGPSGNFLGSDMRAAYYGGSALTGAGQSLALFEYPGYNLADVNAYFKAVKQHRSVPVVGVSVNGAHLDCTGKCDDSEQVLDIEEAISMAPGLKQLVVYVGKNDVSIINQMASDDTSKQLSCSWGFHPDPVVLYPILQELAVQGQSFFVATGDYGYELKRGGVWPSDDRYVTAVGGTDLKTNGPGGAWSSETGWRFSGGGPSPNHIPIPWYQVPFINAANGGSTTLRNVPDVAANANVNYFSCYDGTCNTGNGGTSYAAPLWAGFIALTNEFAATSNEPPVGFLNPALYAIGSSHEYGTAFHDETIGFNGRYSAVPGYDLVTGFGSQHGDGLIKILARGR
jgi:subtilase family serine protease